ncbi:hypothetical protein [Methylobacterium nigriterrae]|uniref:hypothetical protein n=1 Tax=Methylobacterium nigriterrae TaxID=3127512 RepID=UPI0030136374
MKQRDTEAAVAAQVNATIAFDLGAAAAYFEALGHVAVARSLRARAADLLAEAARLQAKLDGVLPALGDAARFPRVGASEARGAGAKPSERRDEAQRGSGKPRKP